MVKLLKCYRCGNIVGTNTQSCSYCFAKNPCRSWIRRNLLIISIVAFVVCMILLVAKEKEINVLQEFLRMSFSN